MQVMKLVVTVIDFDGLGADGVKDAIENARYPNRCISPTVRNIDVRDIGPWSDDHPLNHRDKAEAEYTRLFETPNAALRGDSGLIAGVPLESTVMQQEAK